MFDKLLAVLKRGGTVTVAEVARELDTTPEVVSGMIDHLTRAGQLQPMSVSCDFACNQCLLVRDCRKPQPNRLWRSGD
jgi:DNA-binding MarR family transcriptional regulator